MKAAEGFYQEKIPSRYASFFAKATKDKQASQGKQRRKVICEDY